MKKHNQKGHDDSKDLQKKDSFKETVEEAGEASEETAETAEEAAEAAEETVEELAEETAETSEDATDSVTDIDEMKEVEDALEETSDGVLAAINSLSDEVVPKEDSDAPAEESNVSEESSETEEEKSEDTEEKEPENDMASETEDKSEEEKTEESAEEKDPETEEADEDESSDDEKKDAEETAKEKSAVYMFLDTVKFVAIGLLIGILLVVFVIQRNDVYGSSMEPTLHTGDAVFVEMISVYTGNFSRGDIVTIDAKGMDGYTHEENLIKRIVGLPGETIKIEDGNVYINGQLLDESAYLPAGTKTYVGAEGQARGYQELTLGPDEYYCMGDNRGGSNDSRRMGPFKKKQIDAKVLMRIYPFNKMKFF